MQTVSLQLVSGPPVNADLPALSAVASSDSHRAQEAQGAVKNVGQMLARALLSTGDAPGIKQLAARFERGDVTTGTVRQLVPYLQSLPAGPAASMSNALGKAAQEAPALQAALKKLQEMLNISQMSSQARAENPLSASVGFAAHPRSDFRSLVMPANVKPVTEAQAERSIQMVMNAPSMPVAGFVSLNIEELALQAANLGIKTFGDTASAVEKSQSIATDARKKLMDKQVEDFAKDLEKAIKQQENAKKGGIFGAILKWIAPVLSVVAMVFVPMSLPLMVGMLGATIASTASAALNTAQVVMGPNAPGWLQKLNNIMDWVSTSLGFIVGGSAMWLGERVANGIIQGLEVLTDVAQGINNGVTGFLNTKLQKEINELDLKMEWQEVLVNLFKKSTEDNSRRLEKATDAWSTGHQRIIDVLQENATLRARIARAMV